jgi:TetR/AcrR family transcriptional repressor of nem operon
VDPPPVDTRTRIVVAAMELFWGKGFNSTSVADILSRSQVNSGSLYHFFPGKQDVLVGVLEALRDGIGDMLLAPAWAGVDDPIDRIFALLARYRGAIVESDCTYGCPIGSLALELHEPDPKVRELLAANFTNWTAAIEDCLAAAPERLPADTDRRALAEFVLTAMEGGVMQARTHRDVVYFDRVVAMLRAHFDMLALKARGRALA